MPTTSNGCWTVSVGPHGDSVRAREYPKKGSNVYLFAWDPQLGGNRKESLGFKVRDADGDLIEENVEKAKEAAADLSNRLIRGEAPDDSEPDATAGRVFDLFRREEITDDLSDRHRSELERGVEAWENFLGRSFNLREVSVREWNSFQRQRAKGRIDSRGKVVQKKENRREVGPRTVQKDLKTLRQVCRFAARYRDGGDFILDADPTRGLELPSEPNPNRPVADDETLEKLLEVADDVTVGHGDEKVRVPIRELIVLAAHTGRRIGAIVRLRWSDWNPDEATYGTLRWRADADKLGREWKAPVTPEVRKVLQDLRQEDPGVGEAYIFTAPESDGHVRVDVAGDWLREAERKAEDHEHEKGFGFHAFRRMWATKRKHLSTKDVAHAGGWKDTATLERVYQQPDPETTEEVVLGGRDLRLSQENDEEDSGGPGQPRRQRQRG